jgi:hypothetical protein
MKFNNINEFISRLNEKSYKKPMFDYQLEKLVLKCLFLVDNRVLMISIKTLSIGHSIAFKKNGYFNGLIVPEFYKAIVHEIENKFKGEVNPMWKDLDDYLLNLDIEKISEGNEKDVISIVKTLKTNNKKYDFAGNKPFFDTWVRHIENEASDDNNEKTARNFGRFIAGLCKAQNISSMWKPTPQKDSLDILDLKKTEIKIRNLI